MEILAGRSKLVDACISAWICCNIQFDKWMDDGETEQPVTCWLFLVSRKYSVEFYITNMVDE
jgi:hypothetical protein